MVGREGFGYGCLGMNREVIAFVVLLVVGVFIIVLIGVLVVDVAYETLKVQFSNIVTINKKKRKVILSLARTPNPFAACGLAVHFTHLPE